MNLKTDSKKLYYVGGYVRDEILGVKSQDVDICYEGDAVEFVQGEGFDIVKIQKDIRTARVVIDGEEVDFASTRKEVYPKQGHLPVTTAIGCSLKDDLVRRDFTVNSIAKSVSDGEIYDPTGGLEDIQNRLLRVHHKESFRDDPTRIIRALKFAVRFGFELESETERLQNEYLENINYDMSYHRIKKELKETFNLNRMEAFNRFIKDDIYKLLGPNQKPCKISQNTEKIIKDFGIKSPWIIYLGQFDLSNFELTNEEKTIIEDFQQIKDYRPNNDYEIYKLFNNKILESIILYAISVEEDIALKYLDNLSKIKIETKGADLEELGIKQGKIYQVIFDFLLKNKIENTQFSKKDEIALIKERFL